MNRDEQEMALWREAYWDCRVTTPEYRARKADDAVAEFRLRYPPQPEAPDAVWYDEPPFPKDFATHPCWIADAGRLFAGAVHWDGSEWRVYPMGGSRPYSLNGLRVCPITKPPEPTT